MINIKNLWKSYRNFGKEKEVLCGINLEVGRGEFLSIFGDPGSGKSTLLNVIGLVETFDKGEFNFFGQPVARLSQKERLHLRKRFIGIVFRDLIGELTIYENIELPLFYLDLPHAERKKKSMEALEMANLAHRRNEFPHQLTQVQQLKAAMARAMATNPLLLIADEPCRLKVDDTEEIMRLLARYNDEGNAVIFSSCSREIANYARRTIHLIDGKMIADNCLWRTIERKL